ncbi:MAG: hypothetical protein HOD92_11300 [Deltaproteobacteria bacterium]|jgi:hypothetical protein|nr:hypothetical protein [Deltaproteobacteria bacterium]MBT4526704.1 hypothetical protein [Deltaproteobacteria bacterium]
MVLMEAILKDLMMKYPSLDYQLDRKKNCAIIYVDSYFSGTVSFKESEQSFINWVLFYYDMGRQLSLSAC